MTSKTHNLRYANKVQFRYLKNLQMPALIVPIGYKNTEDSPWMFSTTDGPVPQSVPDEVAQAMVNLEKPPWRIISDGLTIAVECTSDTQEQFNVFEAWLIENNYPYDRIESFT